MIVTVRERLVRTWVAPPELTHLRISRRFREGGGGPLPPPLPTHTFRLSPSSTNRPGCVPGRWGSLLPPSRATRRCNAIRLVRVIQPAGYLPG
ncbi:hypothetical protein E2C01_029553 [Portunus trituberculatus]|uniref:Uncharacterized protein n=1 Tax=Portunus trituberculatus TaxID=210409 RepID=A0A5B7ERR5_PORTR|nr:hypothetical protein [Portunus trituberculatus]